MNPELALWVIIAYFAFLFVVSFLTGRNANHDTFFTANRNAPWYLVAFGMIGASLSGVTFISVPGAVGGNGAFGYFQFIIGNFIGYIIMARVLIPLYYKKQLVSIYEYLDERFGKNAYKTGAIFFLLSRIIGASLRLYLVALVIQLAIGDYFGIPFSLTVFVSILLIYLYTFRGGIKTVVWTDTLQTFCMLLAAGLTVYVICTRMEMGFGEMIQTVSTSSYSKIFTWGGPFTQNFFVQVISGALITLVMTGLDQDMMQKNLTCKNVGEAQKNVYTFSSVFVVANLLFLSLGALLYLYGIGEGLVQEVLIDSGAIQLQIKNLSTQAFEVRRTDELFPLLSLNYLGPVAGLVFVLGVIAAAYSSADSALTALTTSFCVDILGFKNKEDGPEKLRTRYLVHVGFAILLFLVILIFNWVNDRAVVFTIFTLAGYTYGPLLGMYAFGLYTWQTANDKWIPYICLASPLICYLINLVFPLGFFAILVNGVLTFVGLWLIRKK